jgi:alkylhydroperoxidase/carboxymuconolactone decarboxylase family protein YurZ
LPAPFSQFELEREEFEQVTKREHADELATAHHEEWTSPGALHLRQRLQSVGFGCHDVIRRTWLHGLGDRALIPLPLVYRTYLRRGDATKKPAFPHNRKNLVVVSIDIVLDQRPNREIRRHSNRPLVHETGHRLTTQDLSSERLFVGGAGSTA